MAEYREVVIPGEKVENKKGRKLAAGVYQDGEAVLSKYVGIPRIDENEVSVIPLSGVYLPTIGDRIISIISEVEITIYKK